MFTAVHTHLLVTEVQKLVELNTTVGESTERPPLLEVGGELGVGYGGISLSSYQQTLHQHSTPSTKPPCSTHHLEDVVAVLRWNSMRYWAALDRSLKLAGGWAFTTSRGNAAV